MRKMAPSEERRVGGDGGNEPAPAVKSALSASLENMAEPDEVLALSPAPVAGPVPLLVSSAESALIVSRPASPSLSLVRRGSPHSDEPDIDGDDPGAHAPRQQRDAVTSVIGDFGRWQLKVAGLASVAAVFTAWSTLSIAFLAPSSDHWCARPEGSFDNLTEQQWKELAIPSVGSEKGATVFASCEMYTLDSLHLPVEEREKVRCLSWNFDQTYFGETVTSKFSLVCGREWLISTGQGLFMAGKFLGCVVFGVVSDRFGRKTTLMVCAGMKLVFGVIAIFAPSLWVFVSLHFLVAMAAAGMYTSGFVLVMEVIGGKWRSTFGLAFCYPFSIGYIMLAVMAWALRDWWRLQLSISIPTGIFFLFYWILPESPRWLLSKHRYAEAEAILRDAMKMNGLASPKDPSGLKYAVVNGVGNAAHQDTTSDGKIENKSKSMNGHLTSSELDEKRKPAGSQQPILLRPMSTPACGGTSPVAATAAGDRRAAGGDGGGGHRKRGPLDLLRKGYMRRRMVNLFLCWFVNAFVYYGLSLNSANLGGNVFLNFALSGAIEIPAYTLCIVVMLKFTGRRMLIMVSMLTGGVACIIIPLVPTGKYTNDWPVIILSTIGKFGISSSFAIIYIFTAELIPTIVRTVGVGMSSTFARFGSIAAPFVLLLGDKKTGDFTYPMLICGGLAIVSGSLVWLLPETSTNPMPDTFEEARQQTRKAQRLKKERMKEAESRRANASGGSRKITIGGGRSSPNSDGAQAV